MTGALGTVFSVQMLFGLLVGALLNWLYHMARP